MSTIITDLISYLQCGEAIAANDAVYIKNADGKIYKYSPLDPTQVYAGIAKEAGLLNAFIRVTQSGRVKGFSGLTPGAFVYASVTVPGGFQLTDPGVSSKVVLGIAKSATELTVNGALGIKTGGDGTGSGSLDTILQLTATEQLTDWSTGNNATVLGGGTLAGAFVKNTSTPLHGAESYQYTQAAGSLNDYFLSKVFPVDVRFRGGQSYLSFPFKYDGNTSDIQIYVYDVTNSAILTTAADVVSGTNNANQTAIVSALLPLTCTSVRVGFQVKVLNSGKVFQFDDVQLATSVYSNAQLNNTTDWQPATFGTLAWQGLGSVTNNLECRRNGPNLEIRGSIIAGTVTASTGQINFPNNFGNLTARASTSFATYGILKRVSASAAILVSSIAVSGASYFNFSAATVAAANNPMVAAAGNLPFATGDSIVFEGISIPIQGWSAGSNAIVTPTQQVSSDTMAFAFKATAIVDADPIGTFNTYTYAVNSNTATISGSAPTQTTASMNTNGIQIFGRPYNAASTTASPARVDILIGKGLKAEQINAYAGLAKTTKVYFDLFAETATTNIGTHVAYSEITGILTFTAGLNTTVITNRIVGVTDAYAGQSSAYFVFNASTTPSITALPILQPRIATFSDVKANGTAGGTSTTSFSARNINTLDDPTGIISNPAAFTGTGGTNTTLQVQAGTYYLEADIINYNPGPEEAKSKLRNATLGVDLSISLNGRTGSGGLAITKIKKQFTVTQATNLEIQNIVSTSQATNGNGSNSGLGVDNVFLIGSIHKIK